MSILKEFVLTCPYFTNVPYVYIEKIFIPQHEEAKKYISDRIEEMEWGEIFVKKLIRQRTSRE